MILSFVFLTFCILIAWLLYKFALKKTEQIGDFRKLLIFFWVLLVFVLFNSLMIFFAVGGLKMAASDKPISNWAGFTGIQNQDGVIVTGVVSDKNEFVYGRYIAYVDDQNLWTPKGLRIDFEDGSVFIKNDTYQPVQWPVDANRYSYLPVDQAVVVVGFLENYDTDIDTDKSQTLRADLIYGGSFDQFAQRVRFKLLMARGMLFLNLFAALMIGILPIRDTLTALNQKTIKISSPSLETTEKKL